MLARFHATYAPAYEFFGSMGDDQIKKFLTTRQLHVPVRSLSSGQRKALDAWFEAWRGAMKGTNIPGLSDDFLVQLYRNGAAKDLSNVEVGFTTVPVGNSSGAPESTNRVHLWFWVRGNGMGSQFAQL